MGKIWTDVEVAILCDRYPTSTPSELALLLPDRTHQAVNLKACKLGLTKTEETAKRIHQESILDADGVARSYKGGSFISKQGYRMIRCPDHPRARASRGYIFEHILIMEKLLGFPLPDGMVVHHLDGDKLNNDPSNLALMSRAGHCGYHHKGRKQTEKAKKNMSIGQQRRRAEEGRLATNG